MSEYQDYKEKKDEYELDENGRYIGDVKDPFIRALMYVFSGLIIMIPLSIIEAIWFHYLPTGKVIWTCLILAACLFVYLRVECFEDNKNDDDKLVWKAKHRKLK